MSLISLYPLWLARMAAILLTVLCASQSALHAEPTTASQAERVVAAWLSRDSKPMGSKHGWPALATDTYAGPDAKPLYHVVRLRPSGFVIVSGDDLVEPIIAFSPQGEFDPSDANPLGALVSSDLPARVEAARGSALRSGGNRNLSVESTHGKARDKWRRFLTDVSLTGVGTGSLTDLRVDPLVQSTWNQSNVCSVACYNYYTPPNAPGDALNYPVGCVATAMAQLMRFHQYPTAAVGTQVYNISICGSTTTRSIRGGDGVGGPYQWSQMPLVPDCSTTETQRQAIGAVSYDAAVAAHMNFCDTGSGAYMIDASTALKNTFQYSSSKCGSSLAGLTPETRYDKICRMINTNLDAALPVLLGISRTGGGHAVVCDGYGYNASTMYHHLNLGWGLWSGYNNAWYNLPTVDTGIYNYDTLNDIVYNVYSSGTGEVISGRATDPSGNPIAGVVVSAGSYTDTTDTHGIYALTKIPSNTTYTVNAQKQGYIFTPRSAQTLASVDWGLGTGNVWGVDFMAQIADLLPTAKAKADGLSTACQGAVVTAVFGDWFYVEAQDRSAGILAHKIGHGLSTGITAYVIGDLATNPDGERYIEASTVVPGSAGSVPPLGLNARALGGADWQWSVGGTAGQKGVKDGVGLNNIGLLVKLAGNVTYVDPAGAFGYVDDGSALNDGNALGAAGAPVKGALVVLPAGISIPPAGTPVAVTGVSGIRTVNGAGVRALKVRTQDDISTTTGAMVYGRVTQGGAQVFSQTIESPHPYPNRYDNTWTVTGPVGTTTMRVHFTQLQLEQNLDFLYVKDAAGQIKQTYTGTPTFPGWDWSIPVTGSVLKLNLVTNNTGKLDGFTVDKYEAVSAFSVISGAVLTLTPTGQTTTTDADGFYWFDTLAPGGYTLTPSLAGFTFTPTSRAFNLSDRQFLPGADFTMN
ncbi:MAG: C10 family peptidase [Armatimonadetes bacterium]|nr:C10 family peptidase [Armatimonadota bacterium]